VENNRVGFQCAGLERLLRRVPIEVILISSPMKFLICLLTSLVFAAHALLGCGAHRSCELGTAILAGSGAVDEERHCAAHDCGNGETPCDGDREPSETCSHSACSYVKAESQRVDAADDVAAFCATPAPVDLQHFAATSAAVLEPVCRVDLSSTQLYVWHCALII
jgi:hypothetical protein